MPALYLAADFTIPAAVVTQTFAILAKHGVDKTCTASVLVEGDMRPINWLLRNDYISSVWEWIASTVLAKNRSTWMRLVLARIRYGAFRSAPAAGRRPR
jgi:hypothetical protein